MANSSMSGGYLTEVKAPIEGKELQRFIQQFLMGVSGLPGSLVRPAYQQEPAAWPDVDTDWLAFWEKDRTTTGYVTEIIAQEVIKPHKHKTVSHVEMSIQLAAYGPMAASIISRIRDGIQLSQNRDVLHTKGFAVVNLQSLGFIGDQTPDNEYLNRWDGVLTLRREEVREFDISTFLGADGIIAANRAETTLHDSFHVHK